MKERRKARRYDLALPVTIQAAVNNEPACLHGETLDMSTRGICLRLGNYELRVGMKVGLAMKVAARLADGKDLFILAIGRVVRVEKRGENNGQKLGVAVATKGYEYFCDGISDRPTKSLSSLLQGFATRQKLHSAPRT